MQELLFSQDLKYSAMSYFAILYPIYQYHLTSIRVYSTYGAEDMCFCLYSIIIDEIQIIQNQQSQIEAISE